MKPSVLVLGGGISGLSSAMELADDCDVTVVERRPIVGGKSRTWIDPRFRVFREHSFRVFHTSYANTFDTMRRIPYGNGRVVADNLKPFIDKKRLFASYPKTWAEYRRRGRALDSREKLRNARDVLSLAGLLVASERRLERAYRTMPFEELFPLRDDGSRGLVFEVLRGMSQVEYSADRVNPDVRIMLAFIEKHFLHAPPGLGWNALDGPTSDTFLEPWRAHLQARGVKFATGTQVESIDFDRARGRIASVQLRDRERDRKSERRADFYVSALTSDVLLGLASRDLLKAAPSLAPLAGFRRVHNNGVLIFTSRRQELEGGYWMWHPWKPAVTAYAAKWSTEHDLSRFGRGRAKGRIADILSYCLCDWEEPGEVVRKPARECSPDEIYAELCHLGSIDKTVVTNFDPADHVALGDGRGRTVRCLVDEALVYDPTGSRVIGNEDSLVHIPAGGYYDMPAAQTAVPNLVLAGTHCFNSFACGDNMESANESGRRAANAVLAASRATRRVPVLEGRFDSRVVRALAWLRRADAVLDRFTAPTSRRS